MGAFELNSKPNELDDAEVVSASADFKGAKIKDECIIALKVYDQCRQQDCLTEEEIGPARSAECKTIGDVHYTEGAVIEPPSNEGGIKT